MSDFGHQNPSSPLSTLPTQLNQQLVGKNKTTKRKTKPNNKNKTNNNNNFDDSRNNNRLPCKVVHISNPMKFQVNANQFRTLVQELTGRDAAEWPDYYKNYNNNHQAQGVVGGAGSGHVAGANKHDNDNDDDDDEVVEIHQERLDGHYQVDYSGSSDLSLDYFGPFDGDVVMCGHHGHESHTSRVIMEDFPRLFGG